MYLLQHLVDVDAVGFPPPFPPLLALSAACGLGLADGLLRSLTSCFWWHDVFTNECGQIGAICFYMSGPCWFLLCARADF